MISFIVPAHNEAMLIGRTLQAIRESAHQTARPYEVIVVDDASTDDTRQIALQHGAQVLPVNFRRIAATRNAGGRVAIGEFLFFVDADTVVTAPAVRAAVRALRAGAVGGGASGSMGQYRFMRQCWSGRFCRCFSHCSRSYQGASCSARDGLT